MSLPPIFQMEKPRHREVEWQHQSWWCRPAGLLQRMAPAKAPACPAPLPHHSAGTHPALTSQKLTRLSFLNSFCLFNVVIPTCWWQNCPVGCSKCWWLQERNVRLGERTRLPLRHCPPIASLLCSDFRTVLSYFHDHTELHKGQLLTWLIKGVHRS